jgi:hypothetical protein
MKYLVCLIMLIGLIVVPCAADFPWCAQQDLFFWNASSDIIGYKVLDHIPQLASQSPITTPPFTASSGEITLGTWATPRGKPGNELAPGLWRFRTYAYSSTTAGSTTLKFYAINRSASGIETALFFGNAITNDIDATGVPREYLTSYARRNSTTIFPGDRLLIRVNASTDSASARTLTYDMAGNTNASMVSIGYFLCPELNGGSAVIDNGLALPFAASCIGAALIGLILIRRKQ